MNSPMYPIQPKGEIGKRGNEPGELSYPSSVCCEQGYIIVNDTCNHRIQLFDSSTLQFHSMFGSYGNKCGQLKYSRGMCIQPFTRNLLVCDSGNHRIQIFSNNSNSDNSNSDNSNCDSKNNNSSFPYSFLYQIGSTTENGSKERCQFHYPKGICCDTQGHIIVSDSWNHRIQKFNENGTFLYSFGSTGASFDQLSYPYDICFDKEHHQLFIADKWNKRISIWSHDNQPISRIYLNDHCISTCIDPLRNQIVIGTLHYVFVYDKRNYKLIQTLGTGKEEGSELGEFNAVDGLCVNEDDGNLVVADYYNNRIQIF